MRTVFSTAMRQATQLTCEQNIEATGLIQRALGRGHALSPDAVARKFSIDRAASQTRHGSIGERQSLVDARRGRSFSLKKFAMRSPRGETAFN
jgi:hypothetical protein